MKSCSFRMTAGIDEALRLNLAIKYADGEFPPTFANDTSLQIGLEFLFGGKRLDSVINEK